jgi:hypothetical protein
MTTWSPPFAMNRAKDWGEKRGNNKEGKMWKTRRSERIWRVRSGSSIYMCLFCSTICTNKNNSKWKWMCSGSLFLEGYHKYEAKLCSCAINIYFCWKQLTYPACSSLNVIKAVPLLKAIYLTFEWKLPTLYTHSGTQMNCDAFYIWDCFLDYLTL